MAVERLVVVPLVLNPPAEHRHFRLGQKIGRCEYGRRERHDREDLVLFDERPGLFLVPGRVGVVVANLDHGDRAAVHATALVHEIEVRLRTIGTPLELLREGPCQ